MLMAVSIQTLMSKKY